MASRHRKRLSRLWLCTRKLGFNAFRIALALQLFGLLSAYGQLAKNKSLVGTVVRIKAESAEIEVRPESGDAVSVKFSPGTLAQRVAPGEKDLKEAESIKVADVAVGDRVLVNFVPGLMEARRDRKSTR